MTGKDSGTNDLAAAANGSTKRQSDLRGVFSNLSRLLCVSVVAVTLATFGARYFWLSDLLANLRMQQVIAISVSLASALVLRQSRDSGIVAVCLLMHLMVMLPPIWSSPPDLDNDGGSLRVMTFNVLTSNPSHEAIVREINEVSPDIVAILELSSSLDERLRRDLSATWPHRVELSQDGGNFGIGLYSKFDLEDDDVFRSRQGIESIAATCRGIHFIATHPLPPMGRRGFDARNRHLEMIAERVQKHQQAFPQQPVVVMGDLNLTPWSPHFRDFEGTTGLIRAKRGAGIRPTWYASGASFHYGLLLDHIFISPSLGCDQYRIGPDCGSDHRSVSVRIGLTDAEDAAAVD